MSKQNSGENKNKMGGRELQGIFTKAGDANFVSLNQAVKYGSSYPDLQTYDIDEDTTLFTRMPQVARVAVQLSVPNNDHNGWKSGIIQLYQFIRSKNSGRINYYADDLEKYILNVRALWAITAFLNRSAELTNTFESTNSDIPYALLTASSLAPIDMVANSAQLAAYANRYYQQVSKSFPLNLPLFKDTIDIFRYVYKDANTSKSAYYVNDFNNRDTTEDLIHDNNGICYFTSGGSTPNPTWSVSGIWYHTSGQNRFRLTYDQLITNTDKILKDMLKDGIMTIISGEILKAFGKDAFMSMEPCLPNGEVSIKYSDRYLERLENAQVIEASDYTSRADALVKGIYRMLNAPEGGTIDDFVQSEIVLDCYDVVGDSDKAESVLNVICRRYNDALVNAHKEQLTPNEIMNSTRWMPTDSEAVTLDVGGTDTHDGIKFLTLGTEFIMSVEVLYNYNRANALSNLEPTYPDFYYVNISGLLVRFQTSDANTDLEEIRTIAFWSMFRRCPKFIPVVKSGTTSDNARLDLIGLSVMDWDCFGITFPSNTQLYYSYGNLSLLSFDRPHVNKQSK